MELSDYKKYCRCCWKYLESDGWSIDMSTKFQDGLLISTCFEDVTQVSPAILYPGTKMCQNCAYELQIAYKFKQKCVESHQYYKISGPQINIQVEEVKNNPESITVQTIKEQPSNKKDKQLAEKLLKHWNTQDMTECQPLGTEIKVEPTENISQVNNSNLTEEPSSFQIKEEPTDDTDGNFLQPCVIELPNTVKIKEEPMDDTDGNFLQPCVNEPPSTVKIKEEPIDDNFEQEPLIIKQELIEDMSTLEIKPEFMEETILEDTNVIPIDQEIEPISEYQEEEPRSPSSRGSMISIVEQLNELEDSDIEFMENIKNEPVVEETQATSKKIILERKVVPEIRPAVAVSQRRRTKNGSELLNVRAENFDFKLIIDAIDKKKEQPAPELKQKESFKCYKNIKSQKFRGFICSNCNKILKSKDDLLQHIKSCGEPENSVTKKPIILAKAEKQYSCHHCAYCSLKKEDLEIHLTEHHFKSMLKYACCECDQKFSKPSLLKHHFDVLHRNNNAFKCNHCPINYETLAALQNHLGTHLETFKFVCSSCTAPFKTKYALKLHLDNKICYNRKTDTLNNEENHYTWTYYNKYTNKLIVQDFYRCKATIDSQCSQCPAAVMYNKVFLKHVKIYHSKDETHYGCHLCPMKFHFIHGLRLHWEKNHGLKTDIKILSKKVEQQSHINLKQKESREKLRTKLKRKLFELNKN